MSRFLRLPVLVLMTISLALAGGTSSQPAVYAAAGPASFADIQTIPTIKAGVANPAGFAYLPAVNGFVLWGHETELTSAKILKNYDQAGGPVTLPSFVNGNENAALDPVTGELYYLSNDAAAITSVAMNPSGYPDSTRGTSSRFDSLQYGIQNPAGITFDPASGRLFILDATGPRLIIVTPSKSQGFNSGAANREGRTKQVKLKGAPDTLLNGLAFNPKNRHLYIGSPAGQKIFEYTQSGTMVATLDLTNLNLTNIQALTFAPSADQTDAPTSQYLFVLDGGTTTVDGLTAKAGQIVELTLEPMALPVGTTILPASQVRIIDTSKTSWNPSSPDPSGIDYFPLTGRFIIDDSEVDEMSVYAGANVYLSTPSGSLTNTCNTLSFSREPTGIAVNPNNNHIFMTDDDRKEIYEINIGPDNTYCTGDDTVTKASTVTLFGGSGSDPEDIAYGENTLFISGGSDAEVWSFSLGANGILGGGDDGPVSHYDTLVLGFKDLEGIGYYPEAGTLFIVSTSSSDQYIGEVTLAGQLLRAYNVSFMGSAQNIRSDVGYLPSLADPSKKNIYIVSRGIDNDSGSNPSPTENDGKVWEISINPPPVQTPTNTLPPTATFTRTSTSTATLSPTPGPSPTFTLTSSPTSSPTVGPTSTFTLTNTPTNTPLPTFTPTATQAPSSNPLYLSMASNGTIGGISFADEDIVRFDGSTWSLFFDGSDVGVGSSDLFAFDVIDASTIWMAFTSNLTLNGLAVTPRDVVQFSATSLGSVTAGTFSMVLNGQDVGLDANAEGIDSVSVLNDGRILISTTGSVSVPGVSTLDEDILAFSPTSLGSNTSGTWSWYFDGSDVGLADTSSEDIDALDVDSNGNIYLSTLGDFSVAGVAGADEDVFVCAPGSIGSTTSCTYSSTLYFDGSTWGQTANDVDAFNLLVSGPLPTFTPTSTATFTATPTRTPTITPSPTQTFTATIGPSPTWTHTPTITPTFTPTVTLTATLPPTATYTPTNTLPATSTFTPAATSTPANGSIYISLDGGGTVGGVAGEDIDVLAFDGMSWSLFFDASDVGINTSGQDMNDFVVLDANTLLMTFRTAFTLGTLAVEPYDVLQFTATSFGSTTAGTFSLYFDGNDVGLDTTSEVIDALDVLPDGRILISTTGNPVVPGVSAQDEDILAFTPTTLGDVTSGTWSLYFDGTAVGLGDSTNEDVDGLDVTLNGDIFLSTLVDFSVPGISGLNEDVFVCTPNSLGDLTQCTYHSALYFDGSLWGLDANDVDGIYIP